MASPSRAPRPAPSPLGGLLHHHGPTALIALVVIGFGLEAARLASALPAARRQDATATTPVIAPRALAASAWHGLFGELPAAVAVSAAPGTMSLQGTMPIGDPNHGLAIIRIAGTPGLYVVGAEVGGARLLEVHGDHVVLDRGGVREILAMAKPDAAFVLGGNSLASDEGYGYERPREPTADELRASIARATAPLAAVIQAHPLMNDGNFRGLVVEPGPDSATFTKLGLRKGDIIMAVDNKPVLPNTFDVLANDIKSGRNVRVFVKRPGEPPAEIRLNRDALAVAAAE